MVIDGPRYTETWGHRTHEHIPYLSNVISEHGIVNTRFYNNGKTSTVSGYTAITTGNYERLINNGKDNPTYPSIFQYFKKNNEKDKVWMVHSKHKLASLANCKLKEWNNKFLPSIDCGLNGFKSGNRNDSLTLTKYLEILRNDRPKLSMIGFEEPDVSGHDDNWKNYLNGIKDTDKYLFKIWNFIQNDKHYKGKTTLIVTNDHGRHSGYFKKHGDKCIGCKHIFFFAYGPDFKKGITNKKRELIDISATISHLLSFEGEFIKGDVMYELFK